MKTNVTLVIVLLLAVLGFALYLIGFKDSTVSPIDVPKPPLSSGVVYNNAQFGFNFSLPDSWKGYTVISDSWKGNPLIDNIAAQSGVKLIIRHPNWTDAQHYEDLPILIFSLSQWNMYLAESFSISAAPIQATELARNNAYVFALPARWDFDYGIDYKEAQEIMANSPIRTFDIGDSRPITN